MCIFQVIGCVGSLSIWSPLDISLFHRVHEWMIQLCRIFNIHYVKAYTYLFLFNFLNFSFCCFYHIFTKFKEFTSVKHFQTFPSILISVYNHNSFTLICFHDDNIISFLLFFNNLPTLPWFFYFTVYLTSVQKLRFLQCFKYPLTALKKHFKFRIDGTLINFCWYLGI